MAEFVMKSKIEAAGLSDKIYVESAGTSDEELGSPVYPGTRRVLAEHGIDCSGKDCGRLHQDAEVTATNNRPSPLSLTQATERAFLIQ